MKNILIRLVLISSLLLSTTAFAQSATAQSSVPADSVAVVIQITLTPGTKPEAATIALSDMRAFIKKQPGYLSSEFLQNYNTANTPTYVNVVRWASMKYWETVFNTPEFAKLNAAGAKHYTYSASAFKTTK